MTDEDQQYRLAVTMKDGRVLTGTYNYLEAHSHIDWMKNLPGYRGHRMEPIASNRDWTAVVGWGMVGIAAAYLLAQCVRAWLAR